MNMKLKSLKQKPAHDCREELQKTGLKVTIARLAIMQMLAKIKSPLDVQTIDEYLKKNKLDVDKATVFRIVNALTEKGLITQLEFGEGKFRYEHAKLSDHHHFICDECGRIEDISDCTISVLEKDILKKKGHLVKRHSLEFFGLCRSCQ